MFKLSPMEIPVGSDVTYELRGLADERNMTIEEYTELVLTAPNCVDGVYTKLDVIHAMEKIGTILNTSPKGNVKVHSVGGGTVVLSKDSTHEQIRQWIMR